MAVKVILFLALAVGFAGFASAVIPTGPDWMNVTANKSWAGSSSGSEVNVSGGFIFSLNISSIIQNPRWKAFVGWVGGKFTLDDSSDSSIYDWSLSSIGGQIYASRNAAAVDWGNIRCANTTHILAEDVLLDHAGEDNISSTFTGNNSGTYTIAGFPIVANECFATNSYIGNVTQNSNFEELVLYDSTNLVFATEIENAVTGYDGIDYDFQMIVPESGNESFTGSTAYYLYVELN